MGYALSELFEALNERGLTFRRTSAGELEIVGDTGRLTDEIRQAIGEHRLTILSCLPQTSPSTGAPPPNDSHESPKARTANAIRQLIDEFSIWLGKFAGWAQSRFLDSIDQRLAEAVDTQDVKVVALQIQALQDEVEAINWASEILPRTYETEAKHATEAGAGPAVRMTDGDEIPF